MLDARRTTLQLPLMREATALQKNLRTLQDPGTSSGSSSSAGHKLRGKKLQTFIGDPHQDAQALARELSGKLAKSATAHGNPKIIDNKPSESKLRRNSKKKMTAEDNTARTLTSDAEMELGVRERIQRIESALDGSRATTVSGELRRAGLLRELKAATLNPKELQGSSLSQLLQGNYNANGDARTAPNLLHMVQDEEQRCNQFAGELQRAGLLRELKAATLNPKELQGSLFSQLLQGHYDANVGDTSRTVPNLLRMVQDEEQRNQFAGESLFESDEEELDSSMEMEMSRRPREASSAMAAPTPLMLRGKEELKKPRSGRRKKKKPGSARRLRVARNKALVPPRDDELAVSELPVQFHGAIPSRIHKYGGRAFLDITGLTCAALREESSDAILIPELHIPVQSISSLDSDANALPLVIGEDAHDSDLAGLGYFRSRETPQVTQFVARETQFAVGRTPQTQFPLPQTQFVARRKPQTQFAVPQMQFSARESPQTQFAAPQMQFLAPETQFAVPQMQFSAPDTQFAARKSSGKRKASLQNAVKDVPGMTTTTTTAAAPRTLTQKYRPKNFKEIVGQSVVVKSLTTAILKSKVAPVYMFMGPRGTGKTSTARVFAAGLNCLSPNLATRPCGICRECGTMALNRSPDVRHIDAAAAADVASMRAMMGTFTPHVARYKVFIVENCDAPSADIWNSFLKMLEEPPADVVFVLITTDADRIPATATSRCQKFHFLKVKESDIVTRLEFVVSREGVVAELGALALVAARADGSLRDAEIVLDQLCLLHNSQLSVAAVREFVGLLPDNKLFDLLDYALSANTVNIVRALREFLAAGVEPLALVSQLGALITDILVGSMEVDRDSRKEGSFFTRIAVSEKEEHHRLRHALKILSETEKQLRVATDGTTWLTAALLQFAPDRSFLPSIQNTPEAGEPGRRAPNFPVYGLDNYVSDDDQMRIETDVPDEMDAPDEMDPPDEMRAPEICEGDVREDVIGATLLAEQKLEEAWAGDDEQQLQTVSVADVADGGAAAAATSSVQFQLFRDEALGELWTRVVWEVTPRNLKNMLQTHGRLVAAGVAIDGSCAVVELEFDYARDKHKAERSWRSICIAFQAVLSTAVELRIALSDLVPEQSQVLQESQTTTILHNDTTPPILSAQPKTTPEQQEQEQFGVSVAQCRHGRRGTRVRRHRHATEILETELLGAQYNNFSNSDNYVRRPRRRRRVKKRAAVGADSKLPANKLEVMAADHIDELHNSGSLTREIWDALSMNWKELPEEKRLLSSMMEEPQSEIDGLEAAQKKILKQRIVHFRNTDSNSLTAVIDHRRTSLMADLQRGLPPESSLCWKRPAPQSDFLMRKSRVKSVRKAQGKAIFLKLVPCAATHVTPALTTTVIPQLQAA